MFIQYKKISNPLLILIFYSLLFATNGALAEVYHWTDEAGNTVYSDQPRKDAKAVPLPEVTTYQSPPKQSIVQVNKPEAKKTFRYNAFSIVKPLEKDTVIDNSGNVEVEFQMEPRLAVDRGHRIQIKLDDNPQDIQTTALKYKLTNLDRGTHSLQATVVDANNQAVSETHSVTVFVRRASVLHRNAAN